MVLDKKLSLIENKLARVLKGIDAAKNSGNHQLLGLNVRQGFNGLLLKALYLYKSNNHSTDLFSDISDFYARSTLDLNDEITDLPDDRLNIINFISEKEKAPICRSFESSDRTLDYLLGEALYDEEVGGQWDQEIRNLEKCPDKSLLLRTYNNYWKILHSSNISSSLLDLACELFEERRKDSYFSGADQSEGGGEDNDYIIDYRLLAIEKKIGVRRLPL